MSPRSQRLYRTAGVETTEKSQQNLEKRHMKTAEAALSTGGRQKAWCSCRHSC